jgi:hypothetical protein
MTPGSSEGGPHHEQDLADRQLALDETRLKLEQRRYEADNRWFVRVLPVLLGAAISGAGLLLSCAQVRSAQIASSSADAARAQERRQAAIVSDHTWRLDVLRFVAANFEQITSPDSVRRNGFRAVMIATIPDSLAYNVFVELAKAAPPKQRSTWRAAQDSAARQLGTRVFVQFAEEKDRSTAQLLVSDLRSGGFNALGVERAGNQTSALVRYFFELDKVLADSVARATERALAARGYSLTVTPKYTGGYGSTARPGTVELWLPRL